MPDLSDKGYDFADDSIVKAFDTWSTNLSISISDEILPQCPDMVALITGVKIAAYRTKLLIKRNLLTKEQAKQIFENYLNEAVPAKDFSA